MTYKQIRRQKVEMLLEMLENARVPIPPTKLMHSLNVSWIPFRKMLAFLVEQGFLEKLPPPVFSPKRGKYRHDEVKRKDSRIKYLLMITAKGDQLLLRIDESSLSELFEYGRS